MPLTKPQYGTSLLFLVLFSSPALAVPPTAVDDGPIVVAEGGSILGTFNVLTNDTNPEVDPMTATLVTGPANATSFTLFADGTFDYVHDDSNTLTDSFTYQANNGSPSNTATVSISITAVTDAPTAVDDGPIVQNENLVARRNGQIVCTVPDLICVVDTDTGEPVTTELLRYGLRVTVLGLPAPHQWTSPQGLAVAGPQAFGYDTSYSPLAL